MLRQTAFTVAKVCVALFIVAIIWGRVIESRLGGAQMCFQDAVTAQHFPGADGPGVYQFDRDTGRLARISGTMAFAMVIEGVSNPVYSGQSKCGVWALTQTPDGLLGAGSLLSAIVALLIGVFVRTRKGDTESTATLPHDN